MFQFPEIAMDPEVAIHYRKILSAVTMLQNALAEKKKLGNKTEIKKLDHLLQQQLYSKSQIELHNMPASPYLISRKSIIDAFFNAIGFVFGQKEEIAAVVSLLENKKIIMFNDNPGTGPTCSIDKNNIKVVQDIAREHTMHSKYAINYIKFYDQYFNDYQWMMDNKCESTLSFERCCEMTDCCMFTARKKIAATEQMPLDKLIPIYESMFAIYHIDGNLALNTEF
jgi:hypothetical protein